MSFFNFLKMTDINREIGRVQETPGALLLDVRTREEYGGGHIPGSVNLPLQTIDKIDAMAENKEVPLFVYCLSGSRSRQAVSVLKQMGYTNVCNLGGISAYTGRVER